MVGVRDIVDEDGLEEVCPSRAPPLGNPPTEISAAESEPGRRSPPATLKVAEVVRDLTRRDDLKKLSTGEKRMLTGPRYPHLRAGPGTQHRKSAAERLGAVWPRGVSKIERCRRRK